MDKETINDEILALNDNFFDSSLEITNANLSFINQHNLIEPKENYLFVLQFLDKTMQNFTNLDYTYPSKTLKKLHRDIINLNKLYQTHKEYSHHLENLFDTKVLKKISLFTEMNSEVQGIQKQELVDSYDQETIEIIKNQHIRMKAIYWDTFKNDFIEQNANILSSLKNILNTKLYYMDKLIWIDASKSAILARVFRGIKTKKTINSKLYITHRLSIDLPYTDEYQYLIKCIRIYK